MNGYVAAMGFVAGMSLIFKEALSYAIMAISTAIAGAITARTLKRQPFQVRKIPFTALRLLLLVYILSVIVAAEMVPREPPPPLPVVNHLSKVRVVFPDLNDVANPPERRRSDDERPKWLDNCDLRIANEGGLSPLFVKQIANEFEKCLSLEEGAPDSITIGLRNRLGYVEIGEVVGVPAIVRGGKATSYEVWSFTEPAGQCFEAATRKLPKSASSGGNSNLDIDLIIDLTCSK